MTTPTPGSPEPGTPRPDQPIGPGARDRNQPTGPGAPDRNQADQPTGPGAPPGPWASDNLPPHPMAYAPRPDVEQPRSIAQAVRLMFVGAALSAIGVLLTFTQTDAIREAIEDSDQGLTQSEVDTAVNVGIGFAVVSGLVGVGLWIWMAIMNGQGKSWARVVATVFGVLNVVGTLISLTGPGATGLSVVTSLISLALAAVILFLLYRPESSRYYEAQSG